MKTIENLVFKGGGALGLAYIGAFKALQEVRLAGLDGDNPLGNVKRVAGTSAGSIFAALAAIGYSYDAFVTKVATYDFATIIDVDIAADGLIKGDAFLHWIDGLLAEVFKKSNATFGDLARLISDPTNGRYKDLHVFAMSVATKRIIEFSAQTTPDVPIAQAVRASMSIPLVFWPWQFPDPTLAARYPGKFIDGGVAFNYPISTFDSDANHEKTLGFYLTDLNDGAQSTYKLIAHFIEDAFFKTSKISRADADTASRLIEATLDFVIALQSTNPALSTSVAITPNEILDALPIPTNAGPNNADVQEVAKGIVAAASMLNSGDSSYFKAVLEYIPSIIPFGGSQTDIFGFLTRLGGNLEVLLATINPPLNLVFNRDASRTVMINTMGYNFVDFWAPACVKERLINSGYNCTHEYLKMIMYT